MKNRISALLHNYNLWRKELINKILVCLIEPEINRISPEEVPKSPDYCSWLNYGLVERANDFFTRNELQRSSFVIQLSSLFKTDRIETFMKKWLVEYFFALFNLLYSFSYKNTRIRETLVLEDNLMNRFGLEKYSNKFKLNLTICWLPPKNVFWRMASVFIIGSRIIFSSLKSGVKFFHQRKKFKVLREALWELYNSDGYFFHDDFLVDGKKIKKEDLLLFSRASIYGCSRRFKAFQDALKSDYAHFYLPSLPIRIDILFFRVYWRYLLVGCTILLNQLFSPNFAFFANTYWDFAKFALPYEKVFSNYKITSELGHDYYSSHHIPESIICRNYGTKYYLIHWSDHATNANKFVCSFLSCDRYLVWGKAHIRGVEGDVDKLPMGYFFKSFIKSIKANRNRVLSDMGINRRGKIITFFDETFGRFSLMEEDDYLGIWMTALKTASVESEHTIVIKPKDLARYKELSSPALREFLEIKERLHAMPNVYILDEFRWSFIEAIGISDVVVTQGMTSSSTIAIISGIEGLYFHRGRDIHPLNSFKDKIVFADTDKLLAMVHNIINDRESPLNSIPQEVLNNFDENSGKDALDSLREILVDKKKRIGIIIQARMGSTRLPGKVMLFIQGKPVIQHIIDRLKNCRTINCIVLATSSKRDDNCLVNLAKQNKIGFFRGSEEDVLSRYYCAAKKYNFDVIVRITSDCPLIDPQIVDRAINYYLDKQPVDYVSNALGNRFPRGLDVEVFSFESLENAYREATKDYEREHVTPYINQNPDKFKIASLESAERNYSHLRLTLDTLEDFRLITAVYDRLYAKKPAFFYNDIVKVFEQEPELAKINAHVKQKTLPVETCGIKDKLICR